MRLQSIVDTAVLYYTVGIYTNGRGWPALSIALQGGVGPLAWHRPPFTVLFRVHALGRTSNPPHE